MGRQMDNEVKNQFDALAAFRDHAWEEFQEKSGVEWRLSLAVWAAILSAAGAVLATKGFDAPTEGGDHIRAGVACSRRVAPVVSPLGPTQTGWSPCLAIRIPRDDARTGRPADHSSVAARVPMEAANAVCATGRHGAGRMCLHCRADLQEPKLGVRVLL